MFAVFRTGGKQYTAKVGDTIKVEKLEAKTGSVIDITDVLMLSDGKSPSVGAPVLEKAKVSAEVVNQEREDKVLIFKKKRRQNYRRLRGHRQHVTVLRVTGIELDGKSVGGEAPKKAAPAPKKAEAAPAPKAESKPAAKKETTEKKPAAKKTDAKKTETTKTESKSAAKPAAKKTTAKKDK